MPEYFGTWYMASLFKPKTLRINFLILRSYQLSVLNLITKIMYYLDLLLLYFIIFIFWVFISFFFFASSYLIPPFLLINVISWFRDRYDEHKWELFYGFKYRSDKKKRRRRRSSIKSYILYCCNRCKELYVR